jgi:hypothetical protein
MRITDPLLGVVLATAALAAPAARLEPPVPGLGERAELILPRAPADSTERPVGIEVAVRPTADSLRWTVVPLRVGQVGVALPGGADTLWWEVPARLDPDSLPAARPVHGVGILRPRWWPTILICLLLVGPPALWLLRRLRRRGGVEGAFPLPAEPPHQTALRRLAEIRASGWIEAGQLERYYVEASHALRAYVAGRFRVPALDWTTGELEARLAAAGHPRERTAPALPLLAEADRVKFAGERPTAHRAEEWMREAVAWVEATRVEAVYTTAASVEALHRLREAGA